MNEGARVLIGVPSGNTWEADFGMCLLSMMAYTMNYNDKIGMGVDNPKGSILSRSRALIVKRALEMEATHILFIDSDMKFAPQTLVQLLAHEKEVVGANCVTKSLPANPTARKQGPNIGGKTVVTGPDSTGLEEVWRLGFGVMLVHMSVFLRLPQPYFEITWHPEVNDYQGEDWEFCRKLQDEGIQIYVDHDLSLSVEHIGRLAYNHSHVADNLEKGPQLILPE